MGTRNLAVGIRNVIFEFEVQYKHSVGKLSNKRIEEMSTSSVDGSGIMKIN